MTITFSGAEYSSNVVTSTLFGGNTMFRYNLISGSNASYNDAANLLGVTGLRYPGGTMTEQHFDVNNPDSQPASWLGDQPFVGITEFLNYAAATGRDATIVLPTGKMFSGPINPNSDVPRHLDAAYVEQVRNYVERLLTHGDSGPDALPDTPITAFEIGNEYWGNDGMTATEYGIAANALCAALDKVFDELIPQNQPRPQVLVQTGDAWGSQFSTGIYSSLNWVQSVEQSNANIIRQLTDPDALSNITGLVSHYYYSQSGDEFLGDSQQINYMDVDIATWIEAGFGNLDFAVTEWNIKQSNTHQFGLKAASVLIEQFEQMVHLGVDAAFAWPVQGWKTSLAGDLNQAPVLSPAGAAFQMMAEDLVGMNAVESNITGGALEVNAFASSTETVFFVCSRSEYAQHVSLDVSSLISGYSSLSGIKLGIADGRAVDDPDAAALLQNCSASELFRLGLLEFDLKPFEVMEVTFVLPPGLSLIGTDTSERLIGSSGGDTILGNRGNDSIAGGKGLDSIVGGIGNDLVSGWGGNDNVSGGDGADRVFGQAGYDKLFGGTGKDSLYGAEDDDRLDGGQGADYLVGGEGADMFVFAAQLGGTTEIDRIADMEVGHDRIVLDNDYFVGLWTGKVSEAAFQSGTSSAASSWSNKIMYNSNTGDLIFDQDGSRTVYAGKVFAQLDAGLALTFSDFLVI